MKRRELHPPTLCWKCSRSGHGDFSSCPWEASFEPVDGWEAQRTEYGHLVSECPLFTTERTKETSSSMSACRNLVAAVVELAAQDWRRAVQEGDSRTKYECERFLADNCDTSRYILRKLKEELNAPRNDRSEKPGRPTASD